MLVEHRNLSIDAGVVKAFKQFIEAQTDFTPTVVVDTANQYQVVLEKITNNTGSKTFVATFSYAKGNINLKNRVTITFRASGSVDPFLNQQFFTAFRYDDPELTSISMLLKSDGEGMRLLIQGNNNAFNRCAVIVTNSKTYGTSLNDQLTFIGIGTLNWRSQVCSNSSPNSLLYDSWLLCSAELFDVPSDKEIVVDGSGKLNTLPLLITNSNSTQIVSEDSLRMGNAELESDENYFVENDLQFFKVLFPPGNILEDAQEPNSKIHYVGKVLWVAF